MSHSNPQPARHFVDSHRTKPVPRRLLAVSPEWRRGLQQGRTKERRPGVKTNQGRGSGRRRPFSEPPLPPFWQPKDTPKPSSPIASSASSHASETHAQPCSSCLPVPFFGTPPPRDQGSVWPCVGRLQSVARREDQLFSPAVQRKTCPSNTW